MPVGVELAIEPGTKVVSKYYQRIRVDGSIKAQGSELKPISFALAGGNIELWYSNGEVGQVHNSFTWTTFDSTYLHSEYSTAAIDHCTFRNVEGSPFEPGVVRILASGYIQTHIRNSLFIDNNSTAVYYASYGGDGEGVIEHNTITDNEVGIHIVSYGEPLQVSDNNILDNTTFNAVLEKRIGGTDTIDISNNWWGTTNLNQIAAAVYDYSDNPMNAMSIIEPISPQWIDEAPKP